MKNIFFFIIAFIVLVLNLYCAPNLYAYRSITFEMAKDIYTNTCSVCHGENGNGRTHAANALKPKPRNFRSPQAKEELTEFKMLQTVKEGSPGTAMVAWKYNLTDAEIKAVVFYIRNQFMNIAPYPPEGIQDTENSKMSMSKHQHNTPDKTDKPDISEGKRLFLQNCKPCHGEKGDGKGPRYAFIKPHPRRFTDVYDMEGIDKERMLKSVTKGRVGSQMMAWEGILTPQQIKNVVEYVWTEFVVTTKK